MGQSEVARLLEQIDLEYEAALSALTGFACGNARHDFITARMERLTHYHEQLATHVGAHEASRLLVEQLESSDLCMNS